MTPYELIAVRQFPAVVQAADIATLRRGNDEEALADFIGGYLGFDERARYALSTSLQSLVSGRGGAFFLNGVYGSGKSHLLGLLALLCDGMGHEYFLETHPQYSSLLSSFEKCFVVHFSLDEYDAERFSLEAIVQRELGNEWHRVFDEKLELPKDGTRGEYFLALEEKLNQRGYNALFMGIDELSLFLSAKEHRALQADAAFLQFLGQRAARSTPCALHVFAALQKTVEDIGDLEAYSLSQIRDRYTTLQLSLAHLPSLIERRLVIRKDEKVLEGICRDSYDKLHRALPHLDFGCEDWRQLYPFHPATAALLEQVVARFFSRTRSAVLFCAHAARDYLATQSDASSRILPDVLFNYLQPELDTHPELHTLSTVWNAWQETPGDLALDSNDAAALQRLMKTLLLFKISGVAPNIMHLANAIALDANFDGERNYEYARVLLERLRTRGSFLALERNEEAWQDRYAIDLGTRVSELARRHIKNALQELHANDARIAAYALQCAHGEPLPLATLSAPRSYSVMWQSTPREIAVELWSRSTSRDSLVNCAATLSHAGTAEDLLLVIAPPFAKPTSTRDALPLDERWKNAVLFWTPRTPTDDEWQLAREATAAHQLLDDPQLLDNRRGRAILSFIKENAASRETQMAQLATRLLREGEITTASGLSLEAGELASGETWVSTLEAIAEFALPHVFPKFEEVAPRLRVLTASNADAVCLEILRRASTDPYFSASHERIVRALAEPLGVARAEKGRWKIASPRDDLAQEILTLSHGGSTLAAVNAFFSKSEWGIKPEQVTIAICALIRSGEIVAFDGRGQALLQAQVGMPLRRGVHSVRPGKLLDATQWQHLVAVVKTVTDDTLQERSFEEQERARRVLAQWHEDVKAQAELAQARLNQLRRVLNPAPTPWPRAESTLDRVAELLATLDAASNPSDVLAKAIDLALEPLQRIVDSWQILVQQLEWKQAPLIGSYALLNNCELSTPPQLQAIRQDLLSKLQSGEAVLEDDELLQGAAQWRDEYSRLYQDWHNAQHESARWNSLRRLWNSDEMRALERLSTLRSRDFSSVHAIRQAIQNELAKQCPRDGVLLPGEATCNACRLRFGERVLLRDTSEFQSEISQQIVAFTQALQEPSVREYMQRHEKARELLEIDERGSELFPLLSDEILALTDEAFKPGRRVTRSLEALNQSLASCRTRLEFETAFARWLDAQENLACDDIIELA